MDISDANYVWSLINSPSIKICHLFEQIFYYYCPIQMACLIIDEHWNNWNLTSSRSRAVSWPSAIMCYSPIRISMGFHSCLMDLAFIFLCLVVRNHRNKSFRFKISNLQKSLSDLIICKIPNPLFLPCVEQYVLIVDSFIWWEGVWYPLF